MSGSYYTSTRNLFVGSLCALGVFLIGYRHTRRQDRCTSFAGLCALAVAFAPTAPAPPGTEPAWVNYLHHAAAGALIFTLGLFCWVVFADYAHLGQATPQSTRDAFRAWVNGFTAWVRSAWASLRRPSRNGFYVTERRLGPDHPDTLTAQANLAASYRSAGRTDEAVAVEEQVAAARARSQAPKAEAGSVP